MRLSLVFTALLAFVLVSCKQDLGITILTATALPLDGNQLVPARPGAGNGTMDLAYNKTTRVLTYTVKWNSLSGVPTRIGIHGPAGAGFNSAAIQNLTSGFTAAATGTFTGTFLVDGLVVKEADLLRGGFYLVVGTAAAATGEIRGQILVK